MEPMENYGVQVMSIGFLVEQDNPMIWRGPMVTQALEQLLRQTNWGDLDYLIVDMPPGTGDIQLTLSQRVPLTGAVIVTTPQDIALLDARKGIKMFEKVGVPILGIVENMAVHVCEKCGHVEHIFGEEGGKRLAAEYKMDYLGALPLNLSIRVQADSGRPSVVSDPDGEIAGLYKGVARQVAVKIAQRGEGLLVEVPEHQPSPRTPDGDGRRGTRLDCAMVRADALAVLPRPSVRVGRGDGARDGAEPMGGLALSHRRGGAGRGRVRHSSRACCATTASCSARSIPASPRAVPRPGRGLLPQPQLRRAGLVRRLAHRR